MRRRRRRSDIESCSPRSHSIPTGFVHLSVWCCCRDYPHPSNHPPPPQYTLNCGGACSRLYGCRRSCERILHIARNPIKYPLQCRCGATHFPPTTIPHPMPCVSFAYRFIAKQHHRYLLYLQTPRSPIDCVRGMYWGGGMKSIIFNLPPPAPPPAL